MNKILTKDLYEAKYQLLINKRESTERSGKSPATLRTKEMVAITKLMRVMIIHLCIYMYISYLFIYLFIYLIIYLFIISFKLLKLRWIYLAKRESIR